MSWWDDNFLPAILRPEIASAAGAVIGFLNAPGHTRRVQLFNFLAGVGVAVYVAPYFAERMQIQSRSGLLAFSFIAGVVGMNLVAKAIQISNQLDLHPLLPAILKRREPPPKDE